MSEEIIPYHRPFPLYEEDLDWIHERMELVFESGIISNGKYVRELEERIKDLYDVKYCIATSNCTMGLFLCLKYFDWLRPLHMPNFTWISPYILLSSDIHKEFHDINKKTWLMEEKPSYGVVMPTHTFGNTYEIEQNRQKVVHDAAHSMGSKIRNFGDATVLSLAPTKLVTSCEGGLILTDEKELDNTVRFWRDKTSRMSEVHAIIGLQTFEYLDTILEWKKKVFEYYLEHINGQFQEIPFSSNYNTIGFLNTKHLQIPKEIDTRQYYQPIYDLEMCPNALEIYKNIICLPSYFSCPYKKIVEKIIELNKI